MTKKEQREKAIFEYFEQKHADFAGRKITWLPGNDPPDILCTDEAGKRIGVELGEWINEVQMKVGKEQETAEKSFASTIQSRKVPHPRHIGMVWIARKPAAMLKVTDQDQFKKEIYRLVEKIDQEWERNPDVNGPQGYQEYDFSPYPTLSKYLHALDFKPVGMINPPNGYEWLGFRPWGGAYSSQSAIDALASLVGKKTAKYADLHAKEKLDELYLIAYYDQALFYNTPYDTSGTGFKEIAALCSEWLKKNTGKFQKVFLFDSTGDGKVIRLL